tara:strand:+ start:630 stop:752 length:123 start_codon:yes stop_codon:yes gene_type:complete
MVDVLVNIAGSIFVAGLGLFFAGLGIVVILVAIDNIKERL